MKVLIAWLTFFLILWVANQDKIVSLAGKIHAATGQISK
jgi:hypothetical protein